MYTDTWLLLTGIIFLLLSLISIIFLFRSRKRGRVYSDALRQETEFLDAMTAFTQSRIQERPEVSATTVMSRGSRNTFSADNETVFTKSGVAVLDDARADLESFGAAALEGRYVLEKEIHGGGMSRVFLARNAKLGNQWIVKFISRDTGALANEENILKLLNHISLPKIVDIFHDEKGIYLVESYIEGVPLSSVPPEQSANQFLLLDWLEQLGKVLAYLHKMEPQPIFHLDLKPSNIMITHDNRLVLIDFGISKRMGVDAKEAVGVTYKYAAPEQLGSRIPKQYAELVERRFGSLPEERFAWDVDGRTDLYCLGVIMFELATGVIPAVNNMHLLKEAVSPELGSIIQKCLCLRPADRYQTADDLLADLRKVRDSKVKMVRTLFTRRLLSVSTAFTVMLSGGTLSGGYYLYGQESAAIISAAPEIIVVSLQQSSSLAVRKRLSGGNETLMDNDQIHWSFSGENIARIDGNRITGINLGETEVQGQYRGKDFSILVRVVEPMDGLTEISQYYQPGSKVSLYAGSTAREHSDGILSQAEFVSPESMALADDGTLFVADSGLLRSIRNGQADSIDFTPDYLTPAIVRCYGSEVFILTHAWEDEDGYYYGIIRLTEGGAEAMYAADARYTAIEDFAFSGDGTLYFIERNEGVGVVYLKTMNPDAPADIQTLCELPGGTSSLTTDGLGAVYLANPETAVIQIWRDGVLSNFAGVENEKAFIDGNAPLFYMPMRIHYADQFLYIWDFNVLRRISAEGGIAGECITVAGEASPVFDLDITQNEQSAIEIILPNSKLTDFAVTEEGVFITDPKRGVIWQVG